ncbi:hypothetical protein EGT74_19130 [Chitinophaga lutea]|uniref:Uncharacterized protein n=2 Tax=Chitinophaga lutea TaxID=2488634 RepID=A0A3N4QBJ2_9BACT|nr:hypothetical protein EGT74_19130 [Chitinophaga lutea]
MMLCFWVANGRASGRYIMTLLGADNEWHELLNGNCSALHKHTIILDMLTATGEFTCLYSGIRNNYHFRSKSMELEYLVLTKVKRRDFGRPGSTVMLSSNFIVIPAKEILNISIAYVNMDDYLQSGLEQIPDSHHITPVEETLAPA